MCFNPKDKDELCTLGADEIILFWNTKLRNNSVDHFEEESNLKN